MSDSLFESWTQLGRTILTGSLGYICLILLLRISGKRVLSKLSAFDLIVTITLGSTLATVLLSKQVTLVQGVVGFAVLIGMQYLITWSSIRLRWVRRLVTGEPTLLFFEGEFLTDALRKARVSIEELRAAVRQAGLSSMAQVRAIVLENEGSLSVVQKGVESDLSAFQGIEIPRNRPVDEAR